MANTFIDLNLAMGSGGGADISDLVALTGVPDGSTDLGTFTGTTIPDSSTIKEALQALETAGEAENLWNRAGSTLSPNTANDSVDLNAGNLLFNGGNNIVTVLPAEGAAGLNAAYATLLALGGGTIQLLGGTYVIDEQVGALDSGPFNNICLQGVGDLTILEVDSDDPNFVALDLAGDGILIDTAINNITEDGTSITFTVAANAAAVLAGDWIVIRGDDSDTVKDSEYHEVAANGDGGTGVVTLKDKILRTMTGCTVTVVREGRNNTVRDLKMTYVLSDAAAAIKTNRTLNCLIENVTVEDFGQDPTEDEPAFINGASAVNWQVRNCRFRNIGAAAIFSTKCIGSIFENNYMVDFCNGNVSINEGGIQLVGSVDFLVKGNRCYNSLQSGISAFTGDPGNLISRRGNISDNYLENITKNGIYFTIRNFEITNNNFVNCASAASSTVIRPTGSNRGTIQGNSMMKFVQGIRLSATTDNYISVIGNYLEHNTVDDGISIQQDAAGFYVVSDNVLRDIAGAGIGNYNPQNVVIANNLLDLCGGIVLSGNSANVVVNGNSISNSVGGAKAVDVGNNVTNSLIVNNYCENDGITQGSGAGNIFSNNGGPLNPLDLSFTEPAASTNSAGQAVILVDSDTVAVTITLDTSDAIHEGRVIVIKDKTGNAAVNAITIDTEGAETIDEAASVQITSNFGVVRVISNGSNWSVI